ncbi:MAG: response regulator [Chloroflexi bacterium]|nr:response regulator [Chloroflexota bacterium]
MTLADWDVLVIEDEADSMELVQGLLTYYGINSVGALTGEEALEILKRMSPTLIIVDLALPGVDGWGVLKQLKADHRLSRVPRVAITAFHSPELAEEAISAGFDAYFAKPIDATSFVRELQGIVGD